MAAALAAASGSAGTTAGGARGRHFRAPITALALDGSRIAFGIGAGGANGGSEVLVWDARAGTTTKVSGRHTSSWRYGLSRLAIAGSRVGWIIRAGANTSSGDLLFASSLASPQEKQVATVERTAADCGSMGPRCAGKWIGGLVGTGDRILVNRYTTAAHGPGKVDGIDHAVTGGALYALDGTSLRRVATGMPTVEAVSADRGRVSVLRPDGTVALYSSSGKLLLAVTPTPRAAEVALSGRNLVVLEYGGKLVLYNARTGSLEKTLSVRGEPKLVQNLDVQGNIAIYTTGVGFGIADIRHSTLHAVNLSSGKDRVVGRLGPGTGDAIGLARIDTAGLAYSSEPFATTGTLVFVPLARVAAAVA